MQFNEKTFCPHIIDKSTPMKKFLYCSKLDTLCQMVTYFPNGEMIPKQNVKTLGCPYGYAIQAIKKNMESNVKSKSNGLDDTSIKKGTNKSKPTTKTETTKIEQNQTKPAQRKSTPKKKTSKKKTQNKKQN